MTKSVLFDMKICNIFSKNLLQNELFFYRKCCQYFRQITGSKFTTINFYLIFHF